MISIDIIEVLKLRRLGEIVKIDTCQYPPSAHIVSLSLQLIDKEYIKRVASIKVISDYFPILSIGTQNLPCVSSSRTCFAFKLETTLQLFSRLCHAIMILDVTYMLVLTRLLLEIKEFLTRTAECFRASKYIPKQIVKNRHIYPPRAWNAK